LALSIIPGTGNTSRRVILRITLSTPLLDRLCSPAPHQDLGQCARHRRRRAID
jgi:hypothetical protein